MKKIYLIPEICVIRVDGTKMIAESVHSVNGTLRYGGAATTGNTSARVKDQGSYDVWNDDWSR